MDPVVPFKTPLVGQLYGITSERRLVLCAYAITVVGQRRLLAFRPAQSESTLAWEAFLH